MAWHPGSALRVASQLVEADGTPEALPAVVNRRQLGRAVRSACAALVVFQVPTTILFESTAYEKLDSVSVVGGLLLAAAACRSADEGARRPGSARPAAPAEQTRRATAEGRGSV